MKRIPFLLLAIAIALLFAFPTQYTESFYTALKVFTTSVLPVLFMFMVISKILLDSGSLTFLGKAPLNSLFGMPKQFNEVFAVSLFCGYPLGAKMTSEYYTKGVITLPVAQKMCLVCSCPSPMFCIGTVGAIIHGNAKFGLIIWISAVLSTIMCGIVYQRKKKLDCVSSIVQQLTTQNLLYASVQSALSTCLVVGAFFCTFYVVSSMLKDLLLAVFPLVSTITLSTILGCMELTYGCILSAQIPSGLITIALCCFFASFGGLCVLCQSLSFYKECHLNGGKVLLYRLIQGVVSGALGLILCVLFGIK